MRMCVNILHAMSQYVVAAVSRLPEDDHTLLHNFFCRLWNLLESGRMNRIFLFERFDVVPAQDVSVTLEQKTSPLCKQRQNHRSVWHKKWFSFLLAWFMVILLFVFPCTAQTLWRRHRITQSRRFTRCSICNLFCFATIPQNTGVTFMCK